MSIQTQPVKIPFKYEAIHQEWLDESPTMKAACGDDFTFYRSLLTSERKAFREDTERQADAAAEDRAAESDWQSKKSHAQALLNDEVYGPMAKQFLKSARHF